MNAHAPARPQRHDLDWLRVIAIVLLLFFHSAMPYVAEWDWHLKNPETSPLLMEASYFLSRWRMALLFLISGVGTAFALGFRPARGYLRERALRLLVPLHFGILVIVPPQIYMERLTDGASYPSYLHFWPSVLQGRPYPEGNTSWHHLWFIAYLFLYSVAALPLFLYLRSERGRRVRARIEARLAGPMLYLLGLPLGIVLATLYVRWSGPQNVVDDWGHLVYYFGFFVFGYLLAEAEGAWRWMETNRRTSLLLAVASIVTINYLRWNDVEPAWGYNPGNAALQILQGFNAWFWVLAILGFGLRHLSFRNRLLDYAGEGIYPFYLLHQTVIVVIAFYVIRAPDGVWAKFWFTSAVSFALTAAIYDLLVRPYRITRFLFGMKNPPAAPCAVPAPPRIVADAAEPALAVDAA
ncbi:MAG TPA: acyltransferase family protein [Longimicrobium sp.]|nr:acyltransferase family protein [Longimicrobium sp.]